MATFHISARKNPQDESVHLDTVETANYAEAAAQARSLLRQAVQAGGEHTRVYINGRRVGPGHRRLSRRGR